MTIVKTAKQAKTYCTIIILVNYDRNKHFNSSIIIFHTFDTCARNIVVLYDNLFNTCKRALFKNGISRVMVAKCESVRRCHP
jgi:hypothetical protein